MYLLPRIREFFQARNSGSVLLTLSSLLRLNLSLVLPSNRQLFASRAVGPCPLLVKAVMGPASPDESCRGEAGAARDSSPLVNTGPEQVDLTCCAALYFSMATALFGVKGDFPCVILPGALAEVSKNR